MHPPHPTLPVSDCESSAPSLLRAQSCHETLHLRPWGGTRLWQGRAPDHPQRGQALGEVWEFSTLEQGHSHCNGTLLLDQLGHPLPFLAKLVDVQRPLSVQVHPAGASGKEEAWVILDADPNAYILAGLAPGVDPTDLAKAIAYAQAAQGRQDEVFACLSMHPVAVGSVVIIPPKTVHTIPGGILLAEVQDPLDVTYRFFDYGSERETHRERAFANLDPVARPTLWHPDTDLTRHLVSGSRVRVEMLGAGAHALNWDRGERLIVATRGPCFVQHEAQRETLEPGELRLALPGTGRIEVSDGGLATVAWIDPS